MKRPVQNFFPLHAALWQNQSMETGLQINWFMCSWNLRGRVRVVPFQNVSLKGILVKFCPNFSAFSGWYKSEKIKSEQQTWKIYSDTKIDLKSGK